MGRTTSIRALSAGVVMATLTVASPTLIASAAPVAMRTVTNAVSLPPGATSLGAASPSRSMSFSVFLAPRNAAGLAAYAAAVTNSHSASYGHYLARGEFARLYGASTSTTSQVRAALAARGLTTSQVAADGLQLRITAPVAKIDSALSTRIDAVRLADGSLGTGAVQSVKVPAAIASSVLGIVGLTDLVHATSSLKSIPNHLKRPLASLTGRHFVTAHAVPGAANACASATHATFSGLGGITDTQVATAYGANGLYAAGDFASGQTVAVFELEPFALSDVAQFENCYFGHSNTANISTVNVDGGPGVGAGSGESALDIENVAALAPQAHITVYQAPNNTYGGIDAYARIVADDTAKVVTTSWGVCEQLAMAYTPAALSVEHLLFEQAAAQGQTVFASAGDSGANDCLPTGPSKASQSIDDPAGQPYVVSVGGTTAVSVTNPPVQQVWNDGALGGGGGGGPSTLWPLPSWQSRLSSVAASAPKLKCGATGTVQCRVTPDVSGFADEMTGITIFQGGQWGTIGGTSSSAPIWAAMLAEVNASSTCSSSVVTASGVGFASPLLYEVGGNATQYSRSFSDVTVGNNDILNSMHGLYSARVGYDAASGLGSPNLFGTSNDGLAYSLCHDAQAATTSSLSTVSPRVGPVSGGTAVVITGTGFKTGSTSNVSAVNFGELPASSFTVVSPTQINATTPPAGLPHALGNKTQTGSENLVNVTYTSGHVAVGPTFTYRFVSHSTQVPTVDQVGPSGGSNLGGSKVVIYGSGFTAATAVTFGGVAASAFSVVSDSMITATVPPEGSATCLGVSHTGASGLCQSEVVVKANGASSPVVPVLKPLSGSLVFNAIGVPLASPTCGCEVFPSLTEFDFQRAPTISSVRDSSGAPRQNSQGGGAVSVNGSGFNILTLNYGVFGDATLASNQQMEPTRIAYNSVTFISPPDPSPSPLGDLINVHVVTTGGTSNPGVLAYGPVPQITSIATGTPRPAGWVANIPTGGGTTLTLTGVAFNNITEVLFSPIAGGSPTPIVGNFTVWNPTTITVTSPSITPGAYLVVVFGPYGDSSQYVPSPSGGAAAYQTVPLANDEVVANYAGAPVIAATNGPVTCDVSGGCTMTLDGVNLGFPTTPTVYVGQQSANVDSFTSLGAGAYRITITIPPSWLGTLGGIPVYVVTSAGVSTTLYEAYVIYR